MFKLFFITFWQLLFNKVKQKAKGKNIIFELIFIKLNDIETRPVKLKKEIQNSQQIFEE